MLRIPHLGRAEFAERFLGSGPPVVVTDDLTAWAGVTRWTFDELRQRWGDRTVSAWVTPDGEWDHASGRQDVPFSELIDAVLAVVPENRRLRRISGPQLNLERDIPWAAENVGCPAFVPHNRLVSTNLWLQAAGDKTHLHWDHDPGVLGLLHGEKEIALFAPGDRRSLYPIGSGSGVNWSQVDFWRWDAEAFPKFADARPIRLTLRAGEMLIVPPTWWHSVHTTQPSISLNCWWAEPDAEIGSEYRSLLDFDSLHRHGNH